MKISPTAVRIVALGALSAGAVAYRAYRRAIEASHARVSAGSRIARTCCGPIEYAEIGSGPAALVVHGAGGGFDQGMQFAAPLAHSGLRVIAMSRFGYLRTSMPVDASPAAQADAHAALLDALHVDRAAIIGVSAGGPSAMQFAIHHPDRCAALVLVVPLAWTPHRPIAASSRRWQAADRLLPLILGSDFAFWACSRFTRTLVIRHVLATPPELVAQAGPEERKRVDAMIENILPISMRYRGLLNDEKVATTLEPLKVDRIAAPTLISSVRDDGFGTFEMARYVAERIQGARFVGYETGGHLGVGHYDGLLREIERFLARCPSAAGSFENAPTQRPDRANVVV